MQRYFAKEKNHHSFILKDDDLYHIKVVMRMKDNDSILVVFNQKTYLCNLKDVSSNIQVVIEKEIVETNENIPYIRIIIPVLKEQKLDYIFQKATELGVSEFVLYDAKRSIVKINDIRKKMVRWEKIVKEASEQSHRNTIPKITGLKTIPELMGLDGVKFLCSTREKAKNVKNVLKMSKTCDKMNVVIGPEGGLDEREELKLTEMNFIPITLGNRIMRVETVPLFIMSVINYEYME